MNKKTEILTGCDPAQGNSCDGLKNCCKCNENPDSVQVLADIVLASLAPTLKAFLNSPNYVMNPFGEFFVAFSRALLTEAEKHEATKRGQL